MPTEEDPKPTELNEADLDAVIGASDNKPPPPPPPPPPPAGGRFSLQIGNWKVGY